jgi:uncharacterized protein YabN with tetrapyrrole methylase and pyrophosphatase domain
MMTDFKVEAFKKMFSLVEKVRIECPWVNSQNFKDHLDELGKEIEELKLAIENKDVKNLEEELGDVLWDLVTLIKISEEEYGFKTDKIIDKICDKITRRKPYIFGDEKAESREEACEIWKRVKEEERS